MPDAKMWEKIRLKYNNAKRYVCTWNTKRGTGNSFEWPWKQTEPPLWATCWTVSGMKVWHKFDRDEIAALDKRNYADSFKKEKKPRGKGGNRRADMDPKRL
jgi:hypothetical protein